MLLSVLLCGFFAIVSGESVSGRGFGDDFQWHSVEAGLKALKGGEKWGMMVIHKSWCGACKRLGPEFAKSEAILAASKDFVMINVHDDEEPNDEEYTPDGGYIPRILFIDPSTGKVNPAIYNRGGNDKYKYFYMSSEQIASAMNEVIGSNKEL